MPETILGTEDTGEQKGHRPCRQRAYSFNWDRQKSKQVNIIKDKGRSVKKRNQDITLENNGDTQFWHRILLTWFHLLVPCFVVNMFNFKEPQRVKPFICIKSQKQMIAVFF